MGEAKSLACEEVDEAELVLAGAGHGDATIERVEGGRARVSIRKGEGEAEAQAAAARDPGTRRRCGAWEVRLDGDGGRRSR